MRYKWYIKTYYKQWDINDTYDKQWDINDKYDKQWDINDILRHITNNEI